MGEYFYDRETGELYHYGIKGMKWGKRRYQNSDGSLTPAGQKRYASIEAASKYRSAQKEYVNAYTIAKRKSAQGFSPIKKHRQADDERWKDTLDKAKKVKETEVEYKKARMDYKKTAKEEKNTPEAIAARKERNKKIVIAGAAVAGTALAAYGAKKASDYAKEKAYDANYKRGVDAINKYMTRYNFEKVYPHYSDKTALMKKLTESDRMYDKLYSDARDYASRNSKTTLAAVKTLLGKNREFTTAELLNMGIDVFDPKKFRVG